ncbi:GNAT family N-acetyltransferase [Micromonospora sp. NPDC049523]|uniref:GNAT family N-acetyltransferase n=1 Tax=Micromonospora sp. NPDC049523 TaxID=3155921 RepID=UPI003449649A
MPAPELIALAELTEAEFGYELGSSAPESVRSALGTTVDRIGGGVVLAMSNDPTGGFWDKSAAFGVTEPVTDELIGRVVEFHRQHGSPRTEITIAPDFLPPDWESICSAYGLTPGDRQVKLACAVDDFKPATSDLRVGPVLPAHVDDWTRLVGTVLRSTDPYMLQMLAAFVANPRVRAFAAWDGNELVAVATLFVYGECASFNMGITKPTHRNRGAQSALVTARALAAAEAGCRWLTAVTAKPTADAPVTSYNNLVRSGFAPIYERQGQVWQREPSSAD